MKSKLTEKQILDAPESEYMSTEQLDFFRDRLLDLDQTTITRIIAAKEQIDSPMDYSDPSDRATCEEQSNIAFRVVEREQKLLPKIQKALDRIRQGEYGYCLESGEPIGIPRLLARPTSEFCIEVKTLKEIKEHQYKD